MFFAVRAAGNLERMDEGVKRISLSNRAMMQQSL